MSYDNENDFGLDRELSDLALALRENRPTPEPEFVETLDQAVADHFPPQWADEAALGKQGKGGIGTLGERFRRWLAGNRTVIPAFAGMAGVLFIVTVIAVNAGNSGSGLDGGGSDSSGTSDVATVATEEPASGGASAPTAGDASADMSVVPESADSSGAINSSTGASETQAIPPAMLDKVQPAGKSLSQNRGVAKEAEITLGTDPEGVQDVANRVVEVTDDHHGIVMKSNVVDGKEGTAGASFSLLIPSGQIEKAVADLSGIADLKSRSQELTDITAPTNRAEDNIADSKAKIKSLLGELEITYDEDDRAEIERKIRFERQEKEYYETRLNRLERRADYTPVDLRVETGGDGASGDDSSGWGLGDAVDDAGKMLGVAAGVTVIALAVAIPIGIVVLIALALNRAWVRRSRRRVLGDDQ
ncbi:MAG: DUF4349 domain-containing protein [Solirubrobacterales bacterium]|nr:DUF4349 domain-containing protein [Solirubrobacterales bacterium]MCB8915987.1 DUF4349 domain-containing protein [Thermoleophilales bacterium]